MRDWYKRSVIYSLDVDAYRDGDGDGVGDFNGLRKSLPYLSSLGVDCLWLLPFYDTPNRDDGYDVMNYYSVDSRLGNLGTFAEFMDAAKEYNIRVIIDLVANHTSDQNPWFLEALKGQDNQYHDYYIWADKIPDDYEPKKIFGEHQSGNWKYVEEINRYYYHTFYEFQPDLNLANPRVCDEIRRIIRFWLKMGVAGFRMDGVTHMIRKKHESQDFGKDPHAVVEEFREFLNLQAPHAYLLAEADVEPEQYKEFFFGTSGMNILFNFYGNNYLFYALATETATPLVKAFEALPRKHGTEAFANFIRNHDELDLERLSEEERQRVFECFAPDENMRIFGRGIRRRFPSMVNGDRRMMELAYSLLLSLPGTPVIRYGEEIGMGDDLSIEGRGAVRTAMQWADTKNAGFSVASSESLARPVIKNGVWGYNNINVNSQIKDKNSFLNWMTMAITARRRCTEFGLGQYRFLETGDDQVMIHLCERKTSLAIAVHNFSDSEKRVPLHIESKSAEQLIDVFCDHPYSSEGLASGEVQVGPKGYRWFRTGF
jgi:maltose alpha-D-glucosyltransferase/alpha-amylase